MSDPDIHYPNWNKIAHGGINHQRKRAERTPRYVPPTYSSAAQEMLHLLRVEERQQVAALPGKDILLGNLLEAFVENRSHIAIRKRTEKLKAALTQHYNGDEETAEQLTIKVLGACERWHANNKATVAALHDHEDRRIP